MPMPLQKKILTCVLSLISIFLLVGCSSNGELEDLFNNTEDSNLEEIKTYNIKSDFGSLALTKEFSLIEKNNNYNLHQNENDYIIFTTVKSINMDASTFDHDVGEQIEGIEGLNSDVRNFINYLFNNYYLIEKIVVKNSNGFLITDPDKSQKDFFYNLIKERKSENSKIYLFVTIDGNIVGYCGEEENLFLDALYNYEQ